MNATLANISDRATLRLQVTTDAGQVRVRAIEPSLRGNSRNSRIPIKVKGGVRIYPQTTRFTSHGKSRKYKTHCLIWQDAAGRHRERRATLADAEARRDKIIEAMETGQTAMLEFTEADRANWLAVKSSCHRLGRQPVELVSEAVAFLEKLRTLDATANPNQLLEFYAQHRPKGFAPITVTALVEEFLATKKTEITEHAYAPNSYHALAVCLDRFASHFDQVPIHLVASADLNTWLRGLQDKHKQPLGSRARHNHRAAADQVMRWAQANGRLPKTWDEFARVKDPGTRPGEIKILTPDQVTALLITRQNSEQLGRARKKSMMPFLALQLFAGIRHEEICPTNEKKRPLDWSDIRFAERCISVHAQTAKTGKGRIVPISENLAAWLAPYAKPSGPVCTLQNVSKALTEAKKKARIPAGKNEMRNVLRKTFITRRIGIVKHIGQVSMEAGNSPGIIEKHYYRVIPPGHVDGTSKQESWLMEAEAQRHFAISPAVADVLPLFTWAKAQ